MPERRTCSECHTPLPGDAPEGFCPACSLEGALRLGGLFSESGVTRFGDYELLEEIARGGMGVVYRARQASLDRIVAVKLILFGQFANEAIVKRFRAEATSAARLQHPNIVALHEIGEHAGQQFFSMDYVAGRNLAELMRDGPIPAKQAARLLKTIAETIHYAHSQGIVHRDLKPSNILIDALGEPHITDFGLAKNLAADSDLTLSGQVIGSPNFIAPEQAAGKTDAVGPRSDVYSLGAILYQLLTGRPPFTGETLTDTLNQVLNFDPPAPRLLKPNVPRDLETICLKCLEKEPPKRYASAQAVAEELDRFLKDEPISARPVTRAEKTWRWCRRKPALSTAYGVLSLLLLVILIGSPLAAFRINRERQRAEAEAVARRSQLYAAEVNLAQEALAEGNLGRAREFLNRQRPEFGVAASAGQGAKPFDASPDRLKAGLQTLRTDLRGFEWRYVHGLCRNDELFTLHRQEGPLTEVRFAPNGQWLAVTDGKGNVSLWDHRARTNFATLPAYTNVVTRDAFQDPWFNRALAISPDGQRLAVGVGQTVALWDVQTRQQQAVLAGHENKLRFLSFSPDGQTLASAAYGGTVKLWNVALSPPASVATLRLTDNEVPCLAFSPDGTRLAVGSAPNDLRIWDVSTPAAPRELANLKAHAGWVIGVAFSPTSNLLASCGADIRLWNFGSRGESTLVRTLRAERGSLGIIFSLAFSPDGRMLVSTGTDRNVTVWDFSVAERAPVKLKHHEADVLSVAFSSDGHTLASASFDGAVKLWDVRSAWPVAPKMSHSNFINAVAFSPDSKLLASIGGSASLKLWRAASEQLLAERHIGSGNARVTFSPDGRLIATHDNSQNVRVFAVPLLNEITNFPGQFPMFSPAGTDLVYFAQGGICWRNLETHAVHVWKTDWDLERIAISPDARSLVASVGDGQNGLCLWNADSPGSPVRLERHAQRIWSLDFSPDGHWLASGSWDGTNRLWNLRDSRRPAVSLAAHNGGAWAVAFSADSRTLATGGDDNTIRLWHLASFQQTAVLRGHKGAVTALAFASDGKQLASGSNDGTVRIWRAPALEEIDAAEIKEAARR